MEQVKIHAIGTFINDKYRFIINEMNLNDITSRFDLTSTVINNICKYPIKVSKVITFDRYYDYNHDTQPIEPRIPVIDINCTPIKGISLINHYSSESINNVNNNGYQIINKSAENCYHIIIKTFNGIIKCFSFNSIFYVDFVNFSKVNRFGFYTDLQYHVSPGVKEYYQKAFDYLKKECKIFFDKNKFYLFLDITHNEIIIYNNNNIYRYNNIHLIKFDFLLQKFILTPTNCFEEFIINETSIKPPIYDSSQSDDKFIYISDDD